jgi:hypothetical protein
MSDDDAQSLHRGSGGSTYTRKAHATREAPKLATLGLVQLLHFLVSEMKIVFVINTVESLLARYH